MLLARRLLSLIIITIILLPIHTTNAASACVLAALKRARDDQVKELNATISIVGELVDAIAMVESQRKSPLEKQVGKPFIDKLHSFLIQESMKTTRVLTSSPTAIPVPSKSTIPAATNVSDIPTTGLRMMFLLLRPLQNNPVGLMWPRLLLNYMGFPRDLINRAYPIKSGWCVEVREQQHRSLLVEKAKEKGLVAEPEKTTFAYIARNVPQTIRDFTGQPIDTEPLIQQEAIVVTHQKDAKVIKSRSGAWIVVLRRQYPSFRLFDSDPAIPLSHNPRIYSCEHCFGFHHRDKCRYAALPPDTATAQPSQNKISQGRVLKPTREQRAAFRKAGRAAYKAKVAELKNTSTPPSALPFLLEPNFE
ncbi:uncharacterized protein CTHT_0059320 [Thermochaetoides thermophila DSM 1495]|uniref:Uncharacterized protein n=1 Tax=Chaetomium thermophilum (strain DSM 1495 / CBS 144.50 / IMI 039719) TaxID=759272 RepID=G0SEQ4_CHATD|nr:hypothetical protein CTHT_0059320 [Thermochaetoides thermophila DSM 1495]EGS17920.1 hypothetical protein CTHT_0059320 [Thermochaetoides thermophila DSM 1495]